MPVQKYIEYTIQAKFFVPVEKVPEKNIEDILASFDSIKGTEPKIVKTKLVDG
jgi:hypothetical protein